MRKHSRDHADRKNEYFSTRAFSDIPFVEAVAKTELVHFIQYLAPFISVSMAYIEKRITYTD